MPAISSSLALLRLTGSQGMHCSRGDHGTMGRKSPDGLMMFLRPTDPGPLCISNSTATCWHCNCSVVGQCRKLLRRRARSRWSRCFVDFIFHSYYNTLTYILLYHSYFYFTLWCMIMLLSSRICSSFGFHPSIPIASARPAWYLPEECNIQHPTQHTCSFQPRINLSITITRCFLNSDQSGIRIFSCTLFNPKPPSSN